MVLIKWVRNELKVTTYHWPPEVLMSLTLNVKGPDVDAASFSEI